MKGGLGGTPTLHVFTNSPSSCYNLRPHLGPGIGLCNRLQPRCFFLWHLFVTRAFFAYQTKAVLCWFERTARVIAKMLTSLAPACFFPKKHLYFYVRLVGYQYFNTLEAACFASIDVSNLGPIVSTPLHRAQSSHAMHKLLSTHLEKVSITNLIIFAFKRNVKITQYIWG